MRSWIDLKNDIIIFRIISGESFLCLFEIKQRRYIDNSIYLSEFIQYNDESIMRNVDESYIWKLKSGCYSTSNDKF